MKRSVDDYAQALYESVTAEPTQIKQIVAQFRLVLRTHRDQSLLPLILKQLEVVDQEKTKIYSKKRT